MLASLILGLRVVGGADLAEVENLSIAFKRSGWTCQTTVLEDHAVLLVKDSATPQYAFVFERRAEQFLRFPGADPNLSADHCRAGSQDFMWFDTGDWRSLVSFAKANKLASEGMDELELAWAKAAQPKLESIPRPKSPRKATAEEGRELVGLLLESNTVYKSFTSDKGESVDGLPFGTTVKAAWLMGDCAYLDLENKEFRGVGFYPFIVQYGKYSMRLLWNWPEDSSSLVLSPAFADIIPLCEKAGRNGLWNDLNEKAGQAGLWFRAQLSRPPKASACEAEWITKTGYPALSKIGTESRMTVFAQAGKWKVAQMYEGENLHYVEFEGDSIVADLNVEKATDSISSTKDVQLLACYELVCRQAGHPDVCLALFKNPLHTSL